VLLGLGNAPVWVSPVVPGAQGVITPVLSVFPVPKEALLAPVPAFPESDVVAAMLAFCEADGFCDAIDAVRLQAELVAGGVCANAVAESATPNASEAEKINRDMVSSKEFIVSPCEAHLRVAA
jgi:hypothetical protein